MLQANSNMVVSSMTLLLFVYYYWSFSLPSESEIMRFVNQIWPVRILLPFTVFIANVTSFLFTGESDLSGFHRSWMQIHVCKYNGLLHSVGSHIYCTSNFRFSSLNMIFGDILILFCCRELYCWLRCNWDWVTTAAAAAAAAASEWYWCWWWLHATSSPLSSAR